MARKEEKAVPEFMVGTCMSMCPNAEIRLRQREDLIHTLELARDSNGCRLTFAQPQTMVKEFSRSAAGLEMKATDIRPLPVLEKTVRYLLTNVCSRTDVPWALIYQFICDRLRAIRQDLCIQGVKNTKCIKILMSAARFYVYAHYRTCEHELSDFDPYLNRKQLIETIAQVISIYQDLNAEGGSLSECLEHISLEDAPYVESEEDLWSDDSDEDDSERKIVEDSETTEKITKERSHDESCMRSRIFAGRAETERDVNARNSQRKNYNADRENMQNYTTQEEAEALYLLVQFGNEEILMHTLQLPVHIRCSPLVSLVMNMSLAWLVGNFFRVLRLASRLPPLFLCAFHPFLTMVQRKVLSILSHSHSCRGLTYSKEDLRMSLLYDSVHHLEEACKYYGIKITDGGIAFAKDSFDREKPMVKSTRLQWIENKLENFEISSLV